MSKGKNRFPILLFVICLYMTTIVACRSHKERIERVRVNHIKLISASSYDQGFAPELMLDGGPGKENAWLSAKNPTFPQWVEAEYPEAVVLDQIDIQAQYESNHQRRAPRQIEVWGGNHPDAKTYEKVAQFGCVYENAGDWCKGKLEPSTLKSYAYFRIIILNNYGDRDYVAIQELKFFSHE
jgi:Sad1 / UNC-like C-terminal